MSIIKLKPCPVCGREPKIKIYPPNVGAVYCRGVIFHRHRKISSLCVYAQPSEIYNAVYAKWNERADNGE